MQSPLETLGSTTGKERLFGTVPLLLHPLKTPPPTRPSCPRSAPSHFPSRGTLFTQSIEQLEKEMLNGQKLQGPQTARELHSILQHKGLVDK